MRLSNNQESLGREVIAIDFQENFDCRTEDLNNNEWFTIRYMQTILNEIESIQTEYVQERNEQVAGRSNEADSRCNKNFVFPSI